jgi:hypothetical protein
MAVGARKVAVAFAMLAASLLLLGPGQWMHKEQ